MLDSFWSNQVSFDRVGSIRVGPVEVCCIFPIGIDQNRFGVTLIEISWLNQVYPR